MKIFNVVVVYDVYCVAESAETAKDTIMAMVTYGNHRASDDEIKPDTAELLVSQENQIRVGWLEERPIVAQDVSDEDFETLKGKTMLDVYKMLHTKEGA